MLLDLDIVRAILWNLRVHTLGLLVELGIFIVLLIRNDTALFRLVVVSEGQVSLLRGAWADSGHVLDLRAAEDVSVLWRLLQRSGAAGLLFAILGHNGAGHIRELIKALYFNR